MRLEYLAELFEAERRDNAEFRDEVRSKLHEIEQWAAVHEERENTHRQLLADRNKHMMWWVGTIITLLGIILPIVLKVT